MQIRAEHPGDGEAISAVISAEFLHAEHSGGNESETADRLRKDESLAVALVATEDDEIVGQIAFSPVTIDAHSVGWFGLGPVPVAPDRQRHGIGSALIEAGLRAIREQGASGCVVLGNPAYYSRFGFAADPNLWLAGAPAAYFQRLSFERRSSSGVVGYHPAIGLG